MKEQFERRDFFKVAGAGLLPLAVLPEAAVAARAEGPPETATPPQSASQIVVSQVGPLPITKRVQVGSAGPAMLFVSGSVWAQTEETRIGFEVLVEGTKVGEATIYSNRPNTHRSVVPVYLPVFLNKAWPTASRRPEYTITLQPLEGTYSDSNDQFQVMLMA